MISDLKSFEIEDSDIRQEFIEVDLLSHTNLDDDNMSSSKWSATYLFLVWAKIFFFPTRWKILSPPAGCRRWHFFTTNPGYTFLSDIKNQKCCPILANQIRSIIAGTRKERALQQRSNLRKCSSLRSNVCYRTSSLNLLGFSRQLFRDGWLTIRRNCWPLFLLLRLKLIGSV